MKIPVKPVLPFGGKFYKNNSIKSAFTKKGSIALTSARVGIALALKQLNIGQGDKVLIPSFHCVAMIEPIIWLGITPVFYCIKRDLSIDFDDLEAKIDDKVKALIIINYFGFPQEMKAVCDFCNKKNIYLIEDCAHSFWGKTSGIILGESGDWAITSAMKFFAVMEGGYLYSSKHSFKNQKLFNSPLLVNLKSFFNNIEIAIKYGRLKSSSRLLILFLRIKEFLWNNKKKRMIVNHDTYLPSASFGGYSFQPQWIDKKMSFFSQLVIRLSYQNDIILRRRLNYIFLINQIKDLKGITPLFPNLPYDVVPYMVPVLVDYPEQVLSKFISNKIPFLRFGEQLWKGVDKSVCPVSDEYSKKGFQLPCHQDLTEQELCYIVNQLKCLF